MSIRGINENSYAGYMNESFPQKDLELVIDSHTGIFTVSRTIRHFLASCDLLAMRPMVQAIVQELLINAIKANEKRLFFQSHTYDFMEDYQKGNSEFKNYLKNKDVLEKKSKTSEYYAKVIFRITDGYAKIFVENNSQMHPEERKKVESMFAWGKKLNDLTEILEKEGEKNEGAGLGIVMSLIMLKNSGIPPENLSYVSENGKTLFQLLLPIVENSAHRNDHSFVKHFSSSETLIPIHPKTLSALKTLPADTRFNVFRDLAMNDPAFAANLLRLAAPHKFKRRLLERSIRKINIQKLKGNLSEFDVTKKQLTKINQAFEDAKAISSISRSIAELAGLSQESDFPQIAGLLYNVGKIILLSMPTEKFLEIARITGRKLEGSKRPEDEESVFGLSQSTLGWILTRYWNLPEEISRAILFQDRPHEAHEYDTALPTILYTAKCVYDLRCKKMKAEEFDTDYLNFSGLFKKTNLMDLIENLLYRS